MYFAPKKLYPLKIYYNELKKQLQPRMTVAAVMDWTGAEGTRNFLLFHGSHLSPRYLFT